MKSCKIASLIAGLLLSTQVFADVAIVVHPTNSTALSDSDISRAFLGKLKKFDGGSAISVVNQKVGEAARTEFDQKVLHKSSSQVKAYWSKRLFSGKGKPPKELASDADVLKFVAGNANAIGYVNKASVDSSVKVLKSF